MGVLDEMERSKSQKTCRSWNKCRWNQKKCGRDSRCVKKRKSCPRGYNGISKQKGKRGKRCCCKKTRPFPWADCEEFVGYGCSNQKQCGKNGQCKPKRNKCPKVNCCSSRPKMLQLLSMKDSTTKIGSNMDMYYTESKMASDYGNTVYRDSTSGISD